MKPRKRSRPIARNSLEIQFDAGTLWKLFSTSLEKTKEDWEAFFQKLVETCAKHWELKSFPFALNLGVPVSPARAEGGRIVFEPDMIQKKDLKLFLKELESGSPYDSGGWIWTIVHELLHLHCEPLRPGEDILSAEEELIEWFTHKLVNEDRDFEEYVVQFTFEDIERRIHRLIAGLQDQKSGHRKLEEWLGEDLNKEIKDFKRRIDQFGESLFIARLVDKHSLIEDAYRELADFIERTNKTHTQEIEAIKAQLKDIPYKELRRMMSHVLQKMGFKNIKTIHTNLESGKERGTDVASGIALIPFFQKINFGPIGVIRFEEWGDSQKDLSAEYDLGVTRVKLAIQVLPYWMDINMEKVEDFKKSLGTDELGIIIALHDMEKKQVVLEGKDNRKVFVPGKDLLANLLRAYPINLTQYQRNYRLLIDLPIPVYKSHKGNIYTAVLYPNGRVRWRHKFYRSPSGAAKALTKTEVNGWRFWRFYEEYTERERFINVLRHWKND